MKKRMISGLASAVLLAAVQVAFAGPSGQINIPSTDAKGYKELSLTMANYVRFSPKQDAGPNSYAAGFVAGVLPFETVKLEVGADYVTSGTASEADNHPFYFNAKIATAEDAGVKGMPAFALGIYNMGIYDRPTLSTRQNIAYLVGARTMPVLGRLSVGGYYGSERALQTSGNPRHNNSGVMASWDRTMAEISDKLWLGADYMSGNNANGEISIGGSWSFTKQVTLLVGVVWFNPFYNLSPGDAGYIPGNKPAFTTQLTVNLP